MTRLTPAVAVAALLTAAMLVERTGAHHGAGRYDSRQHVEFEGKLTRLDFVNPHSYVYFERVGADGKVVAMKCEMRSATTLRRSGWSPAMFKAGVAIKVTGYPHRDDPTACSVETLTLGSTPTLERYQQLSSANPVDRSKRPFRLPSGPRSSTCWPRRLVGAWGSCRSVRPKRSGPARSRRAGRAAGSRRR
jgi:hypothetical protein